MPLRLKGFLFRHLDGNFLTHSAGLKAVHLDKVEYAIGFLFALSVSGWAISCILVHTLVPKLFFALKAITERLELVRDDEGVFDTEDDGSVIPLPENTEPPEA